MRSLKLAISLAGLLSLSPLIAQDPTEVRGFDTVGVPVQPEFHPAVPIADIPVPPRVLGGVTPDHATPPIPIGAAQPGPNTPPSGVMEVSQQSLDTGAFTYFQNSVVKPTGTSTSTTGEPSVGLAQDTVFQTGNWYAARSLDNGENWSHISPYTRFPAIDGGFCCDQRVYYIASHNITVWLLQYSYGSSTQRGSYRIAVSNGRPELAAGSTGTWTSWTFSPDGNFGFAPGNWMDFPDIAQGGAWLYASANVFAGAGGAYAGSVVWRMEIADLVQHSGLSYAYLTNSTILGSTYRFADRPSTDDRVYFASFNTTTSVYVYYYTNTGTWSRVTRTVGTWTNATASCPGPDGRDWCGRVVGRFRGAFSTPGEIGFIWTSAGNGGSRPQPYSRIARFTADTNRTLIAEHDIWSSTLAFAYGTGRGNSSGDIGLSFAIGGPNYYVRSSATLIDSYQPFGGLTVYPMATGNSGPSGNRWGDYFDVHVHPLSSRTFIGTGMNQNGGSGGANNDPRYVWFGRDDFEPTWVILAVSSTPVTGVPITLSVEDLDNLQNGNTNFSRRFAPQQAYAVTAPLTFVSGRTTYVFDRWATQTVPGGSVALQPVGQLTYDTTNIGSLDDTAEARYVVQRTLSVRSSNPTSGVSVTVSPTDINGSSNGSTSFTRLYRTGELVSLTAPTAIGPDPFRYWTLNGTPQPLGQNSINVAMTLSYTAVAVYWDFQIGSWSSIGAGCVGGNGFVPTHSILQGGAQYVQGSPMTWRCVNAPASAAGILQFGFSTTNWLGFPLPLNLGFIGGTGCTIFHDFVVGENVGSTAAGVAAFTLSLPVQPVYVGTPFYSTFLFLDGLAPRSLPLTFSNAVRLTQGGNH